MIRNYDKLIQNRAEHSFNFIIGVTALIAFVASVLLYTADLHIGYSIINFCVGIVMLIFFLLANKVKTVIKIFILLLTFGGVAVASYVGGAFASAFLTLIILQNIVAVLFLKHKTSIIISISSLGLMIGLALYSIVIFDGEKIGLIIMNWSLQIIGLILLIVILHIAVYSIINYLVENIEGLEKAVKHANQLAYYDQLTSLPNIHKFRMDIKEQVDKHKQNGFIVLFNLKSLSLINSTLGQEFGNQALIESANILRSQKGNNSIIARVGGNEFALWMDTISEEAFKEQMDSVIYELKQKSILLNKKLELHAAYSIFDYSKDSLNECYQRAELMLTYVKHNNIPELLSYNDELEAVLRRKEAIKDLVDQAIIDEEFTLYYQVKQDVRGNRAIGVEGLARWHSKELGFISPNEFIPIIESLNMSVEFGNFVIESACRDYAKLQKKYNDDICVSINISPTHIADKGIIQTISEAIEKYKIPPNKLIVEITEDIIIRGIQEVKPILKALRALNVKISLDDFGSGYSSLNYLTHLELDEIKIDKSFIDQIDKNSRILVLIEYIIKLSKQFNLDIVAEGVETKEQNDIVDRLGCHIIQGYYYSKPEQL